MPVPDRRFKSDSGTLNALSTKSLRDYLSHVRSLVQHNPSVRIRIIKNEVAAGQDSTVNGKIRSLNENRKFLDNLCEQTVYRSKHGISTVPQSIIFDLEIPESATIMNAQEKGKLLAGYNQNCPAAKAFENLGKKVQYVLNMPVSRANGLFERLVLFWRMAIIFPRAPRLCFSRRPLS